MTAEGPPYNGDAPLLGPQHFRAGLFYRTNIPNSQLTALEVPSAETTNTGEALHYSVRGRGSISVMVRARQIGKME